ncbi:hypothetical protein ABC766_32220 (plasmid) [Methylobacterium fujisawaense]|uniref:hypothetical protein n=1 Tax=Methylobacterium fujisawaense TaxID=107400 RepID=UPI0031F5C637
MTVTVTGGDKLEARLKEIASGLRRASTVEVGWLDGASYPDGTPVALVALINEFGNAPHRQPPRPAIRNTIAAKSTEWRDKFAVLLKANDHDTAKALALMGEIIKGDLQQAITEYSGPPLKPSTVTRKGSDKQLVDRGIELAGIDCRVR